MKIAILHSGDLESLALGGVDQYIKNIIRFKDNNIITVFGTCRNGQYDLGSVVHISKDDLTYDFIPVSNDSIRPLTLGYIIKINKYFSMLKEYDVIFSQRIELSLPFVFSKSNSCKLVQLVHGSSYYKTEKWSCIKKKIYEYFESLSIRTCKSTYIILMRDEFGVPYYKRKYPDYADRIKYAKIPIDVSTFTKMDKMECRKKLNLPNDLFIVSYAGRIKNNPKRVFMLPEIIKNINEGKNYYLLMIGGGDDMEELKRIIENTLSSESYHLVGYLSDRNKLVEYLCASDVNINISRFEGTCTSSLEAVACGVPVISTDVGDINLFIKDGRNGIIIPNDEEHLIENSSLAIEKIFDSSIEMNDDYLKYDVKNVIEELFLELYEDVKK